ASRNGVPLTDDGERRPAPAAGVPERALVLTDRELDVLELMAAGLSNVDKCAGLFVSRGDGGDPHQPHPGQAGAHQPGAGGGGGARVWPGPPGRALLPHAIGRWERSSGTYWYETKNGVGCSAMVWAGVKVGLSSS